MNRKFFIRLLEKFHDIRFAASSLAFSSLLSIIPFLIIVLAVFQKVGGLEQFYPRIERMLLHYLKEATGSSVSLFIKSSLANVNSDTLGISGGLFLLWTSLGLLSNIDFAFNKIWGIRITKPFYKRFWLYWIILMAIPIALALFTGIRSVNFFSDINQRTEHRFLFTMGIMAFLFALYKIIPHTKVRPIPAFVSAVLAGALVTVVQHSFLWISAKVFRQNQIYGSLASFPIFLVWLLVVWYVVLSGVALCAFLQHRLAKRP